MTVGTLIAFLENLPKDAKVVQYSNDKNYTYRDVDFQFIHTIDTNGKTEKSLIVK